MTARESGRRNDKNYGQQRNLEEKKKLAWFMAMEWMGFPCKLFLSLYQNKDTMIERCVRM